MSKSPSLATILSGYLSVAPINANSAAIVAAFQNTLSRDGSGPNFMTSSLDMGSNRIINALDPVNNSDGATKNYVTTAIAAAAFGVGAQGPMGPQGAMGTTGTTGATGASGAAGTNGNDGWSPVFSVVTDTTRRVLQVSDWQGGQGTKPATGLYVGATGLTATLATAVDIRGSAGAAGAGSGDVISTNNLSDLTSAATARTNLGLLSASTHAATDFPLVSNNGSEFTASTFRANIGLGTAATHNSGDFLLSANNLSDVSSASAARANIGVGAVGTQATITESFVVALSDETTTLTTGTAKVTMRMPYAFTVTQIRASVNTVSSSGLPTVDVKKNGSSVFSTLLTIDASEKTSQTAATAAVVSSASWSDDDEITFDVTVAGTGTKGLKVVIKGHQ